MNWWETPQYDELRTAGPYPPVEPVEREHELRFSDAGSTAPRWRCHCGEWEMPVREMRNRTTGNNRREAELAYMSHRDEQPGAYGAGPGFN